MGLTLQVKRKNSAPTSGSNLVSGELAFDTSVTVLYVGMGTSVTPLPLFSNDYYNAVIGSVTTIVNNKLVKRAADGKIAISNPTVADDIANKSYVDGLAATDFNIDAKNSVRLATASTDGYSLATTNFSGFTQTSGTGSFTSATAIATTFQGYIFTDMTGGKGTITTISGTTVNFTNYFGASPTSGTFTIAANGNITLNTTQVIDGVQTVAGDRVLVKNQKDKKQNGIYIVGSGGWFRSADLADTYDGRGVFTFVEEGTVNADTAWLFNPVVANSYSINTHEFDVVQFTKAGAISVSASVEKGLTVTQAGNQFTIDFQAGAQGSYLKSTSTTQIAWEVLSFNLNGTATEVPIWHAPGAPADSAYRILNGNTGWVAPLDSSSASGISTSNTNFVTERDIYNGLAVINNVTQKRDLNYYAVNGSTTGDAGKTAYSNGTVPSWTGVYLPTVLGSADNLLMSDATYEPDWTGTLDCGTW